MQRETFAVIGGDRRQDYLARLLREDGFRVRAAGTTSDTRELTARRIKNAVEKAKIIVLPLLAGEPEFGLCRVLESAPPDSFIFAGMVSPQTREQGILHRRELLDYFAREDLQIMNAVPTAEGALALAIEKLPVTVFGSRCLVTGFGRVAKRLCLLLLAAGANVTVSARNPKDLAFAKSIGARTIELSSLIKKPLSFDVLFNTIPALIVDSGVLRNLSKNCLIADLASLPGGVDTNTARAMGFECVAALSLPGKVAPRTAAEYIKETIFAMLEERGVTI